MWQVVVVVWNKLSWSYALFFSYSYETQYGSNPEKRFIIVQALTESYACMRVVKYYD